MPRDIPVGNGQMLVTFDQHYRIRDLYYPHVGQENHAGGGPCRFGAWAVVPGGEAREKDRRKRRLYWTDEDWHIRLAYQSGTNATDVTLRHDLLGLELGCSDVVDFHRPVLVRRIEVRNLADHDREVRLLHHQDLHMYGTKVGDTAYFDPKLRCLIHYRKERYIMACFYAEGEPHIDEYATGTAGFHGAEGTWRDAEDGKLGNNAIAQGAVDSTMMVSVHVPAGGSRVVYLVLGCGHRYEDLENLHQFLHRETPQGVIERTNAYWRLWLKATRAEFDTPGTETLEPPVRGLYKRSLLLVRTQIDNSGAIIAANDSDIMQFARDTYSYMWPRDGAFVADAMDAAGFPDVARSFFLFSARIIDDQGFFLHKYNPDGSPASSWHPWVAAGRPQLPIQEDETALVIWALWRHFVRYRDIEFVRPLWVRLVQPAADFLVRYRDPDTLLPLPSYDLWEERWGVHAFTVATVYGGLRAAQEFALSFGDHQRAQAYGKAAEQTREAFGRHLWDEDRQRFLRRITPVDQDRTAGFMAEVMAGRAPSSDSDTLFARMHMGGAKGRAKGGSGPEHGAAGAVAFERDGVIDSSMMAIFACGLLPVDDPRVVSTMEAVERELWVKTEVGGVARYSDDYYHQVSKDTERVPGNPWFICTLWLADYYIARAKSPADLGRALPFLNWVAERALPSGVLAEQVHPQTNAPLSVSPLTWSHATVVSTVVAYLTKLDQMTACRTCGQALQCPLPDVTGAKPPLPHTPVTEPVPSLRE